MKNTKKYEILEHPGDFKTRAHGNNLAEVFINAALAMMDYLYGAGMADCKTNKQEKIEIKAADTQALLVDWLSELLYLSDTNKRAYVKYEIKKASENEITALVESCPARARQDIKAVTYNELKIEKKDGEWAAEVVFDI